MKNYINIEKTTQNEKRQTVYYQSDMFLSMYLCSKYKANIYIFSDFP